MTNGALTSGTQQGAPASRLLRDQKRALYAYKCVGVDSVPKGQQKDYKTAVHAFGAAILKSGLAAAVAELERRDSRARLLLDHLAKAANEKRLIPLPPCDGKVSFPAQIRALETDDYILATRETLQLVLWLKRAVQATFEDEQTDEPAKGGERA